MRTKAFQQFLAQITKLTPTQRKQALDNIKKMDNTEIVKDVLNTTDHCHYCGSSNLREYTTVFKVIGIEIFYWKIGRVVLLD